MRKAKTKATNLPVPQTDADAERMIEQLGVLHVEMATSQAKHDAAIADQEGKHGEAVKAFKETQTTIIEGLSIWASAHRYRLTNGGRTKTVQLATGTILWREGRFSVKHRGLKVDEVIVMIQSIIRAFEEGRDVGAFIGAIADFRSFLRYKVELNKDAMLGLPTAAEKIPGVTVARGPEEFAVEPFAGQVQGRA